MELTRATRRKRTTRAPAVRRGELLDAALRVFCTSGIAGASVEEITAAAGVAKGTFYLYFGQDRAYQRGEAGSCLVGDDHHASGRGQQLERRTRGGIDLHSWRIRQPVFVVRSRPVELSVADDDATGFQDHMLELV